jgi:hypothetical protein
LQFGPKTLYTHQGFLQKFELFHFVSRMYRPAHGFSAQPEEDFTIPGLPDFWTKTNDTSNLGDFSAICLLFAKNLAEKLENKANSLPYLVDIICWLKLNFKIGIK